MRAIIATGVALSLIAVHALLGFATTLTPVCPLVIQGLAYTGFGAALWPAIPLVVDKKITGLAFGLFISTYNVFAFICPLVIAAIYNGSNQKYIPNVEILFISFGCCAFALGLYLNYYDEMHAGRVLNRPEGEEEESDMRFALLKGDEK